MCISLFNQRLCRNKKQVVILTLSDSVYKMFLVASIWNRKGVKKIKWLIISPTCSPLVWYSLINSSGYSYQVTVNKYTPILQIINITPILVTYFTALIMNLNAEYLVHTLPCLLLFSSYITMFVIIYFIHYHVCYYLVHTLPCLLLFNSYITMFVII